ncbi:alpha/beta hydrolase [Clostridium sp.]|uniref:alpha/beta fold hydrolase n=1 Tax=Clostridium sp. TaxID=1506 RepID=UPI00291319AD|nr:alpha/beta hydrolase [Clostridium sp.]MDU3355583.1 alpha/beta hydrolase [Clostridium sp.]
MKSLNLIPESNGLHRVNMREKLSILQWVKKISIVLAVILLCGFIFQSLSNFVGNEQVRQRLNYVKIDYTIVFDGALGTNLYAWNDVCKSVEKELGVRTLVYNRDGYGFNTIRDKKDIASQTEELRELIKKLGLTDNLILVGEEYGSLIMTNFAKEYPELVSGMVLIRPLSEEALKSKEFKKSIRWKYYKSKVEAVGASFGLTTLMDKLGLTYSIDGFEENLPKGADEEFAVHKTKKNYRKAVSNELENLYKYNGETQIDNMFVDKPLYIITDNENDPVAKIGTSKLTTIYHTESEAGIISSTNNTSIESGISIVLKEAKKIEKLASKSK